MKSGTWVTLCAALAVLVFGVSTTYAKNPKTVTTIIIRGLSADTFLLDGDTQGFLNVGRDEVANTTSLDFSYATPDSTAPDFFILVQGAGEIPNESFIITASSAQLVVTVPFPINRCVVNGITAEFTCGPTGPITFDLTWVKNGMGSIHENIKRTETFGPVTTKLKGEYTSVTATVHGTWTDHDAVAMPGDLVDAKNRTVIREITLEGNP